MFKENPTNKAEKIIAKALKTVNKDIKKDKFFLGRCEIRDCFHQISQTKEKGLLVSYCFEFVDKATGTRKFYGFGTETFLHKITIEKFVKKLSGILDEFVSTLPPHLKDERGQKINFCKVKID